MARLTVPHPRNDARKSHIATADAVATPAVATPDVAPVAVATPLARMVEARNRLQVIETYVTRAALTALMGEAAFAGDEAQVSLCAKALAGDLTAHRACARVIANALAQAVGS